MEDTFKIAEILLYDEHEFINKAVGSWIREAGKKDREKLLAFLDQHGKSMPRVTLRMAIEPEEIEWHRELSKDNQITQVPIVIVLTQSFSKKKAQDMRQALLNENLDIIQIIPVLEEDYEIEDLILVK